MKSVQIPDLGLKLDMALSLATLLPEESASLLTGNNFIRYVRGDGDRLSTFNKWLVGDAGLRIADDVPLLAAVLYRMVHEGITKSDDRSTFRADAKDSKRLTLQEPLLGTAFDFATALLAVVAGRDGLDNAETKLDALLHQALLDTLHKNAEAHEPVIILNGPTRHWHSSGSERLAKHDDMQRVPRGDFIQYLVPPSETDRLVFGFEMLSHTPLVGACWPDVANWFAPKLQHAGQSLLLLDEPVEDTAAYLADGYGECLLQVVGVDVDHLTSSEKPAPDSAILPHDLYRLIANQPVSWPSGYAETVAMLTYVGRLSLRRTRAINGRKRDLQREGKSLASDDAIAIPPRAHLHKARYQVV